MRSVNKIRDILWLQLTQIRSYPTCLFSNYCQFNRQEPGREHVSPCIHKMEEKIHTLHTNVKLQAETAQPREKRGFFSKGPGLHLTCQAHMQGHLRLANMEYYHAITDLFVEKVQLGRSKEQNVFPFLVFKH